MPNQRFQNALNVKEQKTPPIWFMRQAGRYHTHYQNLKKKHSFEDLCKTPELAAEVALGPVKEFDFDLAILFSDILFILEGLGMDLVFDPGPILREKLNESNYKKYQSVENAINFLEFQAKALQLTRNKLSDDKSLIGFVGGPWTILRYALGKNRNIDLNKDNFIHEYLEEVLIPLLKKNITLQIKAGAEVVMILDSGLDDINTLNLEIYLKKFLSELAANSSKEIGYYAKGLSNENYLKLCKLDFPGFGCDNSIDLKNLLENNHNKFFQGNFDQNNLLLNLNDFKMKLNDFCNNFISLSSKQRAGWICGLGHGINKDTNEEHVHIFIETIRKTFI